MIPIDPCHDHIYTLEKKNACLEDLEDSRGEGGIGQVEAAVNQLCHQRHCLALGFAHLLEHHRRLSRQLHSHEGIDYDITIDRD